ncbi:Aminodeoxychorismate synthase component 2 [Botrimarina colliarenosi]|uniref:Aminodeoxychorismate synthase component 2 n=1 Tax=Botrimarina colliarenosi TaxID=2528001 RepID=A0A5C6ACV4_9BACT|nr:aminodeoxychorismate/anthranilate synthase component II [Botrimarina colliarenosi]TWT97882.1 Aminodeoxychorismate synthase component 2 [Botrimarina colliarenosi]
MILVLDNYDSFVHNLARLVRLTGHKTHVVRSDKIDAAGVAALQPEAIVLSPGPGPPAEAGCCVDVVRRLSAALPLLGVCLGHQAIVEAFGGRVTLAPEPLHGRTSTIRHSGAGLFAGAPTPMTVCRYHSLAAEAASLPPVLTPAAWSEDGVVMAVEHAHRPTFGVQFHPEAVLTEAGQQVIDNFARLAADFHRSR